MEELTWAGCHGLGSFRYVMKRCVQNVSYDSWPLIKYSLEVKFIIYGVTKETHITCNVQELLKEEFIEV